MSGPEDATERSRLLDNESGHLNGNVPENADRAHQDDQGADDIPLAKETSTRELLAVMAAIWMGSFFAALGIRKPTTFCTSCH